MGWTGDSVSIHTNYCLVDDFSLKLTPCDFGSLPEGGNEEISSKAVFSRIIAVCGSKTGVNFSQFFSPVSYNKPCSVIQEYCGGTRMNKKHEAGAALPDMRHCEVLTLLFSVLTRRGTCRSRRNNSFPEGFSTKPSSGEAVISNNLALLFLLSDVQCTECKV